MQKPQLALRRLALNEGVVLRICSVKRLLRHREWERASQSVYPQANQDVQAPQLHGGRGAHLEAKPDELGGWWEKA